MTVRGARIDYLLRLDYPPLGNPPDVIVKPNFHSSDMPACRCVVSIGVFDGAQLGMRALLVANISFVGAVVSTRLDLRLPRLLSVNRTKRTAAAPQLDRSMFRQ